MRVDAPLGLATLDLSPQTRAPRSRGDFGRSEPRSSSADDGQLTTETSPCFAESTSRLPEPVLWARRDAWRLGRLLMLFTVARLVMLGYPVEG